MRTGRIDQGDYGVLGGIGIILILQEGFDRLGVVHVGENLPEGLRGKRSVADCSHTHSVPCRPDGVRAVIAKRSVGIRNIEILREPVTASVVRAVGIAVCSGPERRITEVRGDVALEVHAEGENHIAQLGNQPRNLQRLRAGLEHRRQNELDADLLACGIFENLVAVALDDRRGIVFGEGRRGNHVIEIGLLARGVDLELHGVGDHLRRSDEQRRNILRRGGKGELGRRGVGEARCIGGHRPHRKGVVAALLQPRKGDGSPRRRIGLIAEGVFVGGGFRALRPTDHRLRGIGASEGDLGLRELFQIVGDDVYVGIGRLRILVGKLRKSLDRYDILLLPLQIVKCNLTFGDLGSFASVERIDIGPGICNGIPTQRETAGGHLTDQYLRLIDDGLASRSGAILVGRAGTEAHHATRQDDRIFMECIHHFST